MPKDAPQPDARVFYRDIKPYSVPERLDDLRGPAKGTIDLPVTVYWGPQAVVDLATDGGVAKAYQAILREGRVVDQVALLNKDLLQRCWSDLMLPDRVRSLWENRFPELNHAE